VITSAVAAATSVRVQVLLDHVENEREPQQFVVEHSVSSAAVSHIVRSCSLAATPARRMHTRKGPARRSLVHDNAAFAAALPSTTPIQVAGRSGKAAVDAAAAPSTKAMLVRRQSVASPGAALSTATRLVLAADATAARA
jgi:hypothetical protein